MNAVLDNAYLLIEELDYASYDSGRVDCDPDKARQMALQVVAADPPPDVVVGIVCSSVLSQVYPIFAAHNIPMLGSPQATQFGDARTYPHFVRALDTSREVLQSLVLLSVFFGFRRVALVATDDVFGRSVADATVAGLVEQGVSLATLQMVPEGASDEYMAAVVDTLLSLGVKVILNAQHYTRTEILMHACANKGLHGPDFALLTLNHQSHCVSDCEEEEPLALARVHARTLSASFADDVDLSADSVTAVIEAMDAALEDAFKHGR
jgi:ABC-type branched-subunit amino acid transport system substrate-binding protein